MILFRSILVLSLIAVACSSSEPEQENQDQNQQPAFPNLIAVNQPGEQQAAPSKVYVDSVKWVDYEGKKALLITGNLPNGCTYIKEASHDTTGNTLRISLDAWKPADKMCTQALVPFSFVYDQLGQADAQAYTDVSVNDKALKLKKE